MNKSGHLIRTIRLNNASIQKILEQLDKVESASADGSAESGCFPYRDSDCVMQLASPSGGSPTSYQVPTRHISNTGISFLHGSFLYAGACCVMRLTTIYKTTRDVPAQIVRCEYVSTGVHEVIGKFLKPIEVSQYCLDAAGCRVLIADDNESIIRFTDSVLKKLNVQCESVKDGQAAVDRALTNVYDLVLLDIEMPVLDGFQAVRKLRDAGYVGNIVAVTGKTAPDDEQRCLDAGFSSYLPKPLDRDRLASLIQSVRHEPLLSSYFGDQLMRPLIDDFVAELPGRVRRLETAFVNSEVDVLQKACRDLKSDAGSFGFGPISTISAEVEKGLLRQLPMDELKKPFTILVGLCCRAQVQPSA